MQNFGGKWTVHKMNIVIKYVKAYLEIMKDRDYWNLIYSTFGFHNTQINR